MFKMQSNTLSVKSMQTVNTHFKYGNTFWYNLNIGLDKMQASTLSTKSSLNMVAYCFVEIIMEIKLFSYFPQWTMWKLID